MSKKDDEIQKLQQRKNSLEAVLVSVGAFTILWLLGVLGDIFL